MQTINPSAVFKPASANLNWAVKASAGETLYISGLVALELDGTIPADEADQVALVLTNLRHVLAEAGMDTSHLVKMNSYFVTDEAYAEFGRQRKAFLDGVESPASTGVFVSKLVMPELKIEIDAVAVKEVAHD